MELVKDFGIWKIVAHIAFKFYSGGSETFSTASTFKAERTRPASSASRREEPFQADC